jgi:hypothetical protein
MHDLWLCLCCDCAVLCCAGDGWSPRAEDAILHGCIPVVVMDQVHGVFESIIDWDAFSVRVTEQQVEYMPYILMSISPDRLARMQAKLRRVSEGGSPQQQQQRQQQQKQQQ